MKLLPEANEKQMKHMRLYKSADAADTAPSNIGNTKQLTPESSVHTSAI